MKTEDNIAKLKEKLRELFQLDRGDLDFGLYRIMALKSVEVGDFLDNDLLPQVTEALKGIAESDTSTLQAELERAAGEARNLGVDPEDAPKVKELKAQIKAAKSDQQTEADTYNHLYNFFSRYYDQGDFMSLRRYKSAGKEAYSIPYNGEEVKLHWANSDQYYIKTTENYSSYVFIVGEGNSKRRVRFEIATADNEKDNIKEDSGKQRFFVLAKKCLTEKTNELIIFFDHRPLTEGEKTKYPQNGIKRQHAINQDAEQRIFKKIQGDWSHALAVACPTEADDSRTLLGKHLSAYTAKNSFDYFIHKDLGGFLRRELDYYLKSEVISIDNLELADDPAIFIRSLAQVKAIKRIGKKIIDFLAQLEDFQKQLWLKKKFVLETQYCVTLDKVPESLYAEIAKNRDQHQEWVRLFAIDELNGDLAATAYSKPLKVKFLKEHPYLVLDTRYFDQKFTDKLLAALSEAGPIEEQMNGLLVHGENFQALNLLQDRYRGQVQCFYIDPPYNSNTSEILYKNTYKHSSWISLIDNRLKISRILSKPSGSHIIAIDENEQEILGHLLSIHFPEFERVCVAVVHNKKGIQGDYFSYNHEYAYFCMPRSLSGTHGKPIPESEWQYMNLRKWGRESERKTARNCFYPIYVENGEIIGFGDVCEEKFSPKGANVPCDKDGEKIAIYPVDPKGIERKWRYARSSIESIQNLLKVHTTKKEEIQILKAQSESQAKTVWDDSTYIAGDYGTRWLTELGLNFEEDLYPKSIYAVIDSIRTVSENYAAVCDYFAGSGTTGHAVINLNREDGGNRKYILVEIGRHFETVLLPRMKKVTYSKEWKDGKPVDREGISQLFKYIRIESYEDTLDSLTVKSRNDLFGKGENKQIIEDYQLRYALGEETAESASLVGEDFIDPFNYTLSVVRDGVRRNEKVDLAETFNFLLGLRLKSRRKIGDVLAITGTTAKGENCLILWRNLKEMDVPKLEEWFTKYRETFGADLNLIYVNGDHTLNALKKPADK